jgi:hypothetical protein
MVCVEPLLQSSLCSFLMSILSSGDWASGVWNSAGIPGQEQSCAQRTGVSTCEAFVRANGGAMAEACAYHYLFAS